MYAEMLGFVFHFSCASARTRSTMVCICFADINSLSTAGIFGYSQSMTAASFTAPVPPPYFFGFGHECEHDFVEYAVLLFDN
jgi:hypothetical protein